MKVHIGKYPKKAERKVSVEIDTHDTYSLDRTLALIILPALLQLKEAQHGIPSEFAEIGGEDYDNQLSFDFYSETRNNLFDTVAVARWTEVLDKMIWSFQQLVIDDHGKQYHHGKPEYIWKKTDDIMLNTVTNKMEEVYEMHDGNPGEHWYDVVGHRIHEERIQEGLELFGKYYKHLWD